MKARHFNWQTPLGPWITVVRNLNSECDQSCYGVQYCVSDCEAFPGHENCPLCEYIDCPSECNHFPGGNPEVEGDHEVIVSGEVNSRNAGIIEIETKELLEVYPNPFNDDVYFKPDIDMEKGQVLIKDITGRVIFNREFSSGQEAHKINGQHLNPGVYILTIRSEGKSVSKKIIKM